MTPIPPDCASSGGGGAETKPEDSVAVSGDNGYPMLGVRNDTAATLTSADGDYSWIATDAAGRVGIADLGGSITVDGTITATVDNGDDGNYNEVVRERDSRRIVGPATVAWASVLGNRIESYSITVIDGLGSLVGATTATAVHVSGTGYSAVVNEEFLMAAGQNESYSANGRDNEWLDAFTVAVPAGQVVSVSVLRQ